MRFANASRRKRSRRGCARSGIARTWKSASTIAEHRPALADVHERDILQDQIDYYRARAGEYDEWWFRHGRYDRGAEFNARWHAEVDTVERAADEWLARERPDNVLEIACGTGLFTRRIAPRAARVTCVDASPEVLAINRSRVAAANVGYIEADIFEWRPRERSPAWSRRRRRGPTRPSTRRRQAPRAAGMVRG